MKNLALGSLVLAGTVSFFISCGGGDSSGSLIVKGSASATASSKLAVNAGESATMHGSPTSVKLTFYAMWISASADCSNPVQVADFGADGKDVEMFDSPTIVDASGVAEGTYPCLIVEASDIFAFKPDQSAADFFGAGVCDPATMYSFDSYRTGEPETDNWHDMNGAVITSHGTVAEPVADRVFFFASTDPAAVRAHGVELTNNQAGTLLAPLVVPGQTTFFVDTSDRVSAPDVGGAGAKCWLEGFEAGFR